MQLLSVLKKLSRDDVIFIPVTKVIVVFFDEEVVVSSKRTLVVVSSLVDRVSIVGTVITVIKRPRSIKIPAIFS